MTHYRQPGWSLPNGHVVRSHMEASLTAAGIAFRPAPFDAATAFVWE